MLQRIREAACRPERYGDPMIKSHETLIPVLVKVFTRGVSTPSSGGQIVSCLSRKATPTCGLRRPPADSSLGSSPIDFLGPAADGDSEAVSSLSGWLVSWTLPRTSRTGRTAELPHQAPASTRGYAISRAGCSPT